MSKQFGSTVRRRGKFKLSELEIKSREIMATGMFKKIELDSDVKKKFRLLNTPYVLEMNRPPKSDEVEMRWKKRGWKTIVQESKYSSVSSQMIQEEVVKIEEIIQSEKVPILYRRKLLFRLGMFTG